jgi:IS30 family transposase
MAATKVADIDRRMQAAEMLAEGMTVTQIADELGVHRVQIWRWLQRSEVAEHFLVAANTKAARLVSAAVEWMETAFKADDTPAAVKVVIAKLAFERADKLIAVRDRVVGEKPENDNSGEEPQWKRSPWAFMQEKKQ